MISFEGINVRNVWSNDYVERERKRRKMYR